MTPILKRLRWNENGVFYEYSGVFYVEDATEEQQENGYLLQMMILSNGWLLLCDKIRGA